MGKIGGGLVVEQKQNSGSSAGCMKVIESTDLPEEIGIWKPEKNKTHRANIIPYKIASKNHPMVALKKKKVGDWAYCMELHVHTYVHKVRDVVCLKKNYGKPCALCEEADKLWEVYNKSKLEEDKKAAGQAGAGRRVYYLVEPRSGEDKGKLMLWETSAFRMEDELSSAATECEDGAEPIAFYELDAEEGKVVKFSIPEKWNKPFKNFQFLDRDKPVSKRILKAAVAIDSLLTVPSSKEISEFYYGDDFAEDEDEEEKDDDQYYDDDDDDFDDDDSDDDSDSDDDDDDVSDDDEDDDDSDEADDDEDDDDDDDEEEEKPSKKKSKSKSKSDKSSDKLKCPKKHKFGVDYGDYEDCDDCKLEMKCYKATKNN